MPRHLALFLCLFVVILGQSAEEATTPPPTRLPVGSFGKAPKEAKKKLSFTFTFHGVEKPDAETKKILTDMQHGMTQAVECYSQHVDGVKHHVEVHYSPGTPTADGSSNGHIRLGNNSRNQRVCMHEIAHTLGIGTSARWGLLVKEGRFTGKHATAALREITHDDKAELHADRSHFWPYGLNYDNEVKSDKDFEHHCKMVAAILKDLR